MSNYVISDTSLTAIADAIRTKGGTSAPLAFPDGFVDAVEAIETGGGGDAEVALISKTLTSYSNDDVTQIGMYAFYSQSNLVSVSLPNATAARGYGFGQCRKLESVNLPKLQSCGNQEFALASLLRVVLFPALKSFSYQMFQNCSALEAVDTNQIDSNNGLQGYCFQNCSALKVLILRNANNIAKLGNTNSFTGTPLASGGTGGTIYVPSALISSYQAATNWSTILGYANNSIQAIEGSIYENQYADGTPIT